MSLDMIQDRLRAYTINSKQEELNALKEIYQEIALAGLARSNFFKGAAFQGGTALRIVHQLRRFSEDLDFVLLKAAKDFQWQPYLKGIKVEFASFGVSLDVKDRHEAKGAIKTAFLKESSFARILELKFNRLPSDAQKIAIKLEIDTNPPLGSTYENAFLIYPYPFSLLIQDLSSLFASKCHALLCRKYEKGRDWFDFLWYIGRNVPLNSNLLKSALYQAGPYKEKEIEFNTEWVRKALENKIVSLNWDTAKRDVESFLNPAERRFIDNWNKDLFLSQLSKIEFK